MSKANTKRTNRPRRRVRSRRAAERYRLNPGDPAFRDSNLRAVYWIVGVLPRDELEIVSAKQIADTDIVSANSFEDIVEAVNDGRLTAYKLPRDRLTPYPANAADRLGADEVDS